MRVAGVKARGGVDPPEPLPDSGMTSVVNEVVSVNVSPPLIAPFAVGENVTAMLHLALGPNVPVQVVPVELRA